MTPPLACEHAFDLCGALLVARAQRSLWWPDASTLIVADLHLGKSERMARRGGLLLPPYETAATLDRLADEIAALAPARVICLGDSFDDGSAAASLDPSDAARLASLMAGRRWIWITGNHDPGPLDLGGTSRATFSEASLTFRHEATTTTAEVSGEVSGHFHPKYRLAARGRIIARPCFLFDARRLILPAFGAYTGGLWADHPALSGLFAPPLRAVLTGRPCVALPVSVPAPARRSTSVTSQNRSASSA